VVSLTTDGFITNIEDLENKLLNLPIKDITFFSKYSSLRLDLSNTITALEEKYRCKGTVRWTTICQLGIVNNIKATTGFQSNGGAIHKVFISFAWCFMREKL
jgi:hypothetical protein